jgi:hypothetical protein
MGGGLINETAEEGGASVAEHSQPGLRRPGQEVEGWGASGRTHPRIHGTDLPIPGEIPGGGRA